MYINWEKQTLNQQLELSVSFSLFLVHYIFNIIILPIFYLYSVYLCQNITIAVLCFGYICSLLTSILVNNYWLQLKN